MKGRGLRIHWAWLPAAIVATAVLGHRHGPWVAVLAVVAGLALAAFAEWRARRRRRREAGR